jgi:1-acyl-sn-glycerol-3-phosphate acyltransferase
VAVVAATARLAAAERVDPPASALRRLVQSAVLAPAVRLLCQPLGVEGAERASALDRATLLVANHASHLDAPVIVAALPGHVRARLAVAAAEDYFFRGRWLGLAAEIAVGAFPFPRDRRCAVGLERAAALLESGWHVLLFPEGSRSASGQLGPFRRGAAHLLLRTGVPVLPIGVVGAGALLPRGASWPRRGPVTVRFGAPWRPDGGSCPAALTDVLANRVADLIAHGGSQT